MSTTPKQTVLYEGGCHCGAVRFQVTVDDYKADQCNCSICRKKGFLHLIVPPEQFKLLQGAEMLSTYTLDLSENPKALLRQALRAILQPSLCGITNANPSFGSPL